MLLGSEGTAACHGGFTEAPCGQGSFWKRQGVLLQLAFSGLGQQSRTGDLALNPKP